MKVLQRICTLLVCLALMTGFDITASAAGTVTYEGNAQKFIFAPGSEYSPTDLFADFKDVMPGDSITQDIQIKNDASNNVKIELYMRSLGAQEGSEDFLSKLHLKVSQDGSSNLFDAPADQTAQLTEWVHLGTFYSGANINLNVILEVPIEMGNEYQEAIGYLNWQFKVEELPIEIDDSQPDQSEPGNSEPSADAEGLQPPKTGDTSNLILYIVLVCVAGVALTFLLLYRNRKDSGD